MALTVNLEKLAAGPTPCRFLAGATLAPDRQLLLPGPMLLTGGNLALISEVALGCSYYIGNSSIFFHSKATWRLVESPGYEFSLS